MKIAFNIPQSQKIRVEYVRGSTKYSAVIPRPQNNDELACVMLKRQVGMSQIRSVNEFVPNVVRA